MATGSPELIFASYSWARRDHMVRLMRARPLSVSNDCLTRAGPASLRRPALAALLVGTRKVMRFSSKVTVITWREIPATFTSSMPWTVPTPWVGYTTMSPVRKSTFTGGALGAPAWASAMPPLRSAPMGMRGVMLKAGRMPGMPGRDMPGREAMGGEMV